jgi:hypothetical protein
MNVSTDTRAATRSGLTGVRLVTMNELHELPDPLPLPTSDGRFRHHKPVRHDTLVTALAEAVTSAGWDITETYHGLAAKDKALFGVMKLRGDWERGDSQPVLGFRSSVDKSVAIKGVAGASVFVCSNLCMAGDEFVFGHKSTTNLQLPSMLGRGLQTFRRQSNGLQRDIRFMENLQLQDRDAKIEIHDLFKAKVLPAKLFLPVSDHYFARQTDDCRPRSVWGLNNACTRAIQSTNSPQAQFNQQVSVGRYFKNRINRMQQSGHLYSDN